MTDAYDTDMYDKLTEIAGGIQRDVEDTYPEGDSNFDLWIEELRGPDGRYCFGVIDMGEMYQGVYIWDGRKWEQDSRYDPHQIISRIIRQREFNST